MAPVYDMSQYGVSDAVEPSCVEAGKEVRLQIKSVRVDTDRNGNDYFMPLFEPVEVIGGDLPENPKAFSDFLGLPSDSLSASDNSSRAWKLNTFLRACGLDPAAEIDPESDLPGKECCAIVGLKHDEQYGESNTIRKYIAGA